MTKEKQSELNLLEVARISQGIRDYLMTRYAVDGAKVQSEFGMNDQQTAILADIYMELDNAAYKKIKVTMEFTTNE